jgi:hypothetical protein
MCHTLFSLEVHFGGIFVRIPNLVYEGGDVGFSSNYDKDHLSYFEVKDICKFVGASKGCKLYYLIPGVNLVNGLRHIVADDDVLFMSDLHEEWKVFSIIFYIESGDMPIRVLQPGEKLPIDTAQ